MRKRKRNRIRTWVRRVKRTQHGGFLPLLIPAITALGSALATGGATALGAWGANKLLKKIDGRGKRRVYRKIR